MKLFKPKRWLKKLSGRKEGKEISSPSPVATEKREIEQFVEDKYVLSTVSWYWPDIDGQTAAQFLNGQKNGTFLVRKSSTPGFAFTLTYTIDGKVGNLRVHCKNGLFSLCFHDRLQPRAPTMQMLVEKLVEISKDESYVCELRREENGAFTNVPLKLEKPLQRNISLQDHCRRVIMRSVCNVQDVDKLNLPTNMEEFLLELKDKE